MIEVHDLRRSYGGFEAVRGLDFVVGDGEIVGMLGPNGAGKTTTLRMITGFLPPSSGDVVVAGRSLLREPVAARRELGYLPENVVLYPEMRVEEFLSFRARLQGLRGSRARSQVAAHVESCLLQEVEGQIIGTLSKGYRQRVGLAAALLHDPPVLVLDEPTVGLDPKQIVAIRELIRELGESRTVLLSTHILTEVELLCQRVQIMDRGRIVAQGTPESLSEQWIGRPTVALTLVQPPATAESVCRSLLTLEGVVGVDVEPPPRSGEMLLALEVEGKRDLRAEIFSHVVREGWTLLGLAESKASLEDVFVRLTREEEGDDLSEEPAGEEARPDGTSAEGVT